MNALIIDADRRYDTGVCRPGRAQPWCRCAPVSARQHPTGGQQLGVREAEVFAVVAGPQLIEYPHQIAR